MLRAMHCKVVLGTSLPQSIKNLQNTTMNKKVPLASKYYKVLQHTSRTTPYFSVLQSTTPYSNLRRNALYHKVLLRSCILCTTKYQNVLQTTATYYKIQLRIQKKFGGQTSEYGGMNSRDGKSKRKSRRETGKESSRLSTAAGCRAISGPMRTEEGTRCDETHFQVEVRKPPQLWTIFGSLDAEKLQCCRANAPCSSRFCKIRCRKTACHCGGKYISN